LALALLFTAWIDKTASGITERATSTSGSGRLEMKDLSLVGWDEVEAEER
jgi:hypothetical protein